MLGFILLENFTTVIATLFGVVGLIYLFVKHQKLHYKSKEKRLLFFNDLPGPNGYPILGHLTKLGTLPYVTITNWSKKYGSMYRIRMGLQDVLIISGIKNIRSALLKHSVAFAGRPHLETFKMSDKEGSSGVAFSDYSPAWLYEKGIAKAALSLYTTGKDPSKRSVLEISSFKHANSLIDQLLKEAKTQDDIAGPRRHILSNITNVICKICFGEEFELDDPKFLKLMELYKDFDKAMGVTQVADFWPILKYFPVVSRAFHNLHIFNKQALDIVKSFLKSHWETYDDNNIRDLVDSLYHERKKSRGQPTYDVDNAQIIPDLSKDTGA